MTRLIRTHRLIIRTLSVASFRIFQRGSLFFQHGLSRKTVWSKKLLTGVCEFEASEVGKQGISRQLGKICNPSIHRKKVKNIVKKQVA